MSFNAKERVANYFKKKLWQDNRQHLGLPQTQADIDRINEKKREREYTLRMKRATASK